MWRRIAVAVLLLGGLSVLHSAAPRADAAQVVYLPLVPHRMLPVEVVITANRETGSYVRYFWVNGYVRNLSDVPLHEIELEIIETWYPQDDTGPYPYAVGVSPAFTTTLPGQINPFTHQVVVEKLFVHLGRVTVVDGRPSLPEDPVTVALEVGEWEHSDRTLRGTVRNTSAYPVRDVRVIVAPLGECPWRAATPDVTQLMPEEETAFAADIAAVCLEDDIEVLGQGMETDP